MSNSRDLASLLNISKAAQKGQNYKQGMDKAAFLNDDKTQSAIIFQFVFLTCDLTISDRLNMTSSDLVIE